MAQRIQRGALALLASSSFLSLAAAAPAFAQDTAVRALETVTVTARKTEESAQDVPISLTALSGDALATISAGGADIQVLSARVPSVVAESSFGRTFPRFYIRGLGNTDFDLNASQPVSMVYDDVVYENPILKGYPVFDVERVEVLRGPQGTLFGRNTPGGIIKFDSVKPSQDLDLRVRGSLGTMDTGELELVAGGGLSDTVAVRLSLLAQMQGDTVDNAFTRQPDVYGGYGDFAYRAQMLITPNDQFSALLNVHGRIFNGTSQLFRANIIRQGTGGFVAGFDRDRVFYDGGDGNNQRLETSGVTATLTYDWGDTTLTYVGAYESAEFYGRGDIDGGFGASFAPPFGPGFIPFDSDTADAVDDLRQVTHELRLAHDAGRAVSWLIGAYRFAEDVTISSYSFALPAFGGGLNGFARQDQETRAWAVFGSATYKPSDALTLTAGLRYSDDKKDFVGNRFRTPIGFTGAADRLTRRASVGDEAVSWDLSAVYAVNPDVNLYGRIARGFRAPSIQGRILFGDVVTTAQSEFVTSYEAGVKGVFLDGRARADLTVYTYTVDDQQFTAIGGAGNFNQLLNAKEGQGSGFEAQVEWLPIDALQLTAALSYNNTEIKDGRLTVAPCGAPCTVLDPRVAATGAARINGNSFPNAPEWIGNLTARYAIPAGDNAEWFVFTDWSYKGETNFFLYESREFREDGFWEGGLRLGWTTLDGKKEFALFGRNITDEERLIGGIDFNNLTGFLNNPAVWGVSAKIRN